MQQSHPHAFSTNMNAADIQRLKELLPTTLGSEEIRETIASQILRRSIFSARMASATHLSNLREVLTQISAGTMDRGTATLELTRSLQNIGHSPLDWHGITNPASRARIDLIVRTNRQDAASCAQIMGQTEDTLDDYPGWELRRFSGRRAPRGDWHRRWEAAGNAVGWEGAARHTGDFPEWSFIALKSSPIWAALGSGAGGFRDARGADRPPFAFGSGLAWDDVERERCEKLGIIRPGERIAIRQPDMSPSAAELSDARERTGFDLSGGLDK